MKTLPVYLMLQDLEYALDATLAEYFTTALWFQVRGLVEDPLENNLGMLQEEDLWKI